MSQNPDMGEIENRENLVFSFVRAWARVPLVYIHEKCVAALTAFSKSLPKDPFTHLLQALESIFVIMGRDFGHGGGGE